MRFSWLKMAALVALTGLTGMSVHAQDFKTDKKLESLLANAVKGFNGTTGIYVRNLKTGRGVALNADTVFPTASIIKVPILVGLFNKIDKGELKYRQPMVYRDSIAREGSGLMQFFKDKTPVTLDLLAALMIGYSDNTTSLWCQALAGGGEGINKVMAGLGLKDTRVNSRTPGREAAYKDYGWGQTTPRELAELVVKIRQGKAGSAAACNEMYRLMTHVYYDQYALSQVPPYVQAAAKQGMVNAARSEVVLVNAPHGDYVVYIATKNIKDQSWNEDTNEAWQLQRRISALLWNYYEPAYGWKPTSIK